MAAGAGTFYADPKGLALCLRNASVGQSFVYAKGPALDPGHAVVRLVQEEQAAGRVSTNLRRSGDDLHYLVRVLEKARKAMAAAPIEAPAIRLHHDAQRVFDLLERVVAEAKPCPSNDRIAEALGLRDRQAARYRFDQLVAAGLIKVIEPARFGPRIIEITATGKRTGKAQVQGVTS